jgi:class 3 adenylate cyclase
MKRPLLPALIIGLIAAAIVLGLHASGLLAGPELAIKNLLLQRGPTTRSIFDQMQYPFVLILACGVAWMTFMTARRARLGGIIAILLVELLGVAWVCSLYQVLFQPVPAIGGAALGFLLPIGFMEFTAFLRRRRERAPVLTVEAAVAAQPRPRAKRTDLAPEAVAQACEVTAVVCDIANKHDLAEECEPAVFVEITEKFLAHATEAFRKAGAYIESAGGEGVVAIFGYPESDKQHAEKATRKAMALTQAFSDARKSGKSDGPTTIGVHAGVSSGIMIMAPVKNNGQRSLLATGEPVELARRFCIANRFYGSRVLLGPRTFELASKILVARPIDFLSGVDVRERHEIYEPVALALEASRDQITRRDAFWNGVVLYREKRWAEAYSQFQNARGPEGEEDRPLQLYLRRLEPLALQLTNTPLDE